MIGELISEEDESDDNDNEIDEDNESHEDGTATPSNLERIINERTNILFSASSRNFDLVLKSTKEKKPRKVQRKQAQLKFDLAILRLIELEMSEKLRNSMPDCSVHYEETNKDCFECSLINIIP